MQVTLLTNVFHDGRFFAEGTSLEVEDAVGKQFVDGGLAKAGGDANASAPLVDSPVAGESQTQSPVVEAPAPEAPVAPVTEQTPVTVSEPEAKTIPVTEAPALTSQPTQEEINATLQAVESAPPQDGSGVQLQ